MVWGLKLLLVSFCLFWSFFFCRKLGESDGDRWGYLMGSLFFYDVSCCWCYSISGLQDEVAVLLTVGISESFLCVCVCVWHTPGNSKQVEQEAVPSLNSRQERFNSVSLGSDSLLENHLVRHLVIWCVHGVKPKSVSLGLLICCIIIGAFLKERFFFNESDSQAENESQNREVGVSFHSWPVETEIVFGSDELLCSLIKGLKGPVTKKWPDISPLFTASCWARRILWHHRGPNSRSAVFVVVFSLRI